MFATSPGVARETPRVARVAASVALYALAGVPLQAQQFGPTTVRAAADSQRVLRDARSAHAAFERTRRWNLPQISNGSGGRCDVRVGRFCYWRGDDEYDGPEEPRKIAEARERLLTELARAAERLPADEWIVGQRVRFLVEHGDANAAVSLAKECTARAPWCAALGGFALHALSDFAAADSAFDAALRGMNDEERCKWTDITLLLEGDARKRYDKLPCLEREAFERTFWALARPLHLWGGNDRRTEHFARVTMAELQRTSRSPHDLSWGDDMRELMLRYGWAKRWSREPPSITDPTRSHVVGYEPTPAFDFVPAPRALLHPHAAEPDDWSLRDPSAYTRYAPNYVKSFTGLEHQVALFRRGDSTIVVAAFDLRRDTAFARGAVDAALAVAPASAPESVEVVARMDGGARGGLRVAVPRDTLIVSVEARDSVQDRLARVRLVSRRHLAPAARVTVSDLLLLEDADSLPASLDEAVPRARGSMRVNAATPLGVFWEMYGVETSGETLEYTLTVTREGTPWYRRAAERVGLADRRAPVHMRWDEPSARPGAARSRALAVDFSTLPSGRYRVELTLAVAGQEAVKVGRVVEVER